MAHFVSDKFFTLYIYDGVDYRLVTKTRYSLTKRAVSPLLTSQFFTEYTYDVLDYRLVTNLLQNYYRASSMPNQTILA